MISCRSREVDYRLVLTCVLSSPRIASPPNSSQRENLQLNQPTHSKDAGVISVHRPSWRGEPQYRGPAEPTKCQQPQHRDPQQVQSCGYGRSQSGTTLCPERSILQRTEHEDWHEVSVGHVSTVTTHFTSTLSDLFLIRYQVGILSATLYLYFYDNGHHLTKVTRGHSNVHPWVHGSTNG